MTMLLTVVCILFCGDNEQSAAGHVSYVHGKKYEFSITVTQFKKMPKWDMKNENPPLSARKAIQLSEPLRQKLIPDTSEEEWKLRAVVLKPSVFDKWYWVVIYEASPVRVTSQGPREEMSFIILMDGTVIQPTVEKRK